jgi:hypothetical protein
MQLINALHDYEMRYGQSLSPDGTLNYLLMEISKLQQKVQALESEVLFLKQHALPPPRLWTEEEVKHLTDIGVWPTNEVAPQKEEVHPSNHSSFVLKI